MHLSERLAGCILGGAIGDAWGSGYENLPKRPNDRTTFYLLPPPVPTPRWQLTDDTQLTLEALCQEPTLSPTRLATCFGEAYAQGQLTGLGASTLQALRALQVGGGTGARWGAAASMGPATGRPCAVPPSPFGPR